MSSPLFLIGQRFVGLSNLSELFGTLFRVGLVRMILLGNPSVGLFYTVQIRRPADTQNEVVIPRHSFPRTPYGVSLRLSTNQQSASDGSIYYLIMQLLYLSRPLRQRNNIAKPAANIKKMAPGIGSTIQKLRWFSHKEGTCTRSTLQPVRLTDNRFDQTLR